MNLLDMQNKLRSRIGNPTAIDVPDSVLATELNAAYLDIVDRYRFHRARKRCLFSTVIGQARYDLPTDVLAVLRIRDNTNNRKMEKWGDRQLSSRTDDNLGQPLRYVRYRDWVELNPTPDGVYQMEVFYKFMHEPMIAGTDVPQIPPSWHEGVIVLGKYNYYANVATDAVKAGIAYEAFTLWVSNKPTEIDEESVDIDSGVEVVPLSGDLTPRLDWDHAD
jgi:hypothetical protein